MLDYLIVYYYRRCHLFSCWIIWSFIIIIVVIYLAVRLSDCLLSSLLSSILLLDYLFVYYHRCCHLFCCKIIWLSFIIIVAVIHFAVESSDCRLLSSSLSSISLLDYLIVVYYNRCCHLFCCLVFNIWLYFYTLQHGGNGEQYDAVQNKDRPTQAGKVQSVSHVRGTYVNSSRKSPVCLSRTRYVPTQAGKVQSVSHVRGTYQFKQEKSSLSLTYEVRTNSNRKSPVCLSRTRYVWCSTKQRSTN